MNEKTVDPDMLASDEDSPPGSTLFKVNGII